MIVWVAIGSVTALALGWWSSLTEFYSLGAATAKTNLLTQYKVRVGMEVMDSLARRPTGLTSGDVTVEELRTEGDEPSLTAEALAEKIGESLATDDDL